MLYGLFAAVVAAGIVVFSLENAGTVPVSFLGRKLEMPMVSIVVVSVLSGIVLAQLLRRWSSRSRSRSKEM